jgi:hypothetical protein
MMTEQDESTEITEIDSLKDRATIMGITFHPNIGVDKLRAKIEAKMSGEDTAPDSSSIDEVETIVVADNPATLRKNEALRLVRIRVACMNPVKANMKGEIVSVGNSELGFVKKFVPFNAEQGYHVPNIILQELQNKKFVSHFTVKVGNKTVNRHKLVPEYGIEILAPLTADELDALKQRQIIASSGV